MDLIHYLQYVAFRYVTLSMAVAFVVFWLLWDPKSLDQVFDLNLRWEVPLTMWLWEQGTIRIAPHLSPGIWELISVTGRYLQSEYANRLEIVAAFAGTRPKPEGIRIYVGFRAITGQGWIVATQIAILIRFVWTTISTIRRSSPRWKPAAS